jgi:hypothetical protein
MSQMDDTRLRSAYRHLMEGASSTTEALDIAPEVLQQLADGTYAGADRDALLERALSHDQTARELSFLLDVRAASVDRPVAQSWRRWAMAATLLVVVISGVRLLGGGSNDEPMRSPNAAVTIVEPGAEGVIEASTRFTWRAVTGATRYDVEVLRADGSLLASATTPDTSATLAFAAPLTPGVRVSWWVTATLADGTTRRSAPTSLRTR